MACVGAASSGFQAMNNSLVLALSDLEYHEFVGRMDDVSRDLRMEHATWADPAGLDDSNLASARDMLKAVTAVSLHPELSAIASADKWRIERKKGPQWLGSTNRLVKRWETLALLLITFTLFRPGFFMDMIYDPLEKVDATKIYEVAGGIDYTLNDTGDLPVEDYLKVQRRFKHLGEGDYQEIQRDVDRDFELIRKRAEG